MPDTYFVQKTKTSNPFAAVLIGLAMFAGSFVVIYKNEGRINLAHFGEQAKQYVQGTSYQPGDLLAVTGKAETDQTVGDNLFKTPESVISLERTVEMYAWTEDSHDRDGGTEYTYKREWTESPEDSSHFEVQSGHENPEMPFRSETFTVPNFSIDGVTVSSTSLSLPDHTQSIELTSDNTTLNSKYGKPSFVDNGQMIYIKNMDAGVEEGTHIGDIRVSYHAIPNHADVTVFGAYANGPSLAPYEAKESMKDSTMFYHMRYGDKVSATQTLGNEFKMMLWILRILGFILMLAGLNLIVSPLQKLLGYIPIVGAVGNFVLGLILFVTTIVLYVVALVVSIVAHSLIGMIIAGVVVLAIGAFVARKFATKPAAAPMQPAAPQAGQMPPTTPPTTPAQ